MKHTQHSDGVLALLSTLVIAFVVMFFSLAYFLTYRVEVERRTASAFSELEKLTQHASTASQGDVAGYQTGE